jgi:peptidoglycan/xylan/chitin deacetylase (PgdA/CDA1 family)
MRYLRRHYSVLGLGEAFQWLRDGEMSVPKSKERLKVVITVDDGFADNFEIMAPLVRSMNIPVTVFLATDFLDTGRSPWPTEINAIIRTTRSEQMDYPFSASLRSVYDRAAAAAHIKTVWRGLGVEERREAILELGRHLGVHSPPTPRPLSWEQVHWMRRQAITFGSHTVYHSMLPFIDPSLAFQELIDSRQRVEEELGEPCPWLAYPNGDYNDAVIRMTSQAGYEIALAQQRGVNSLGTNPFAMHRIEVPPDESLGCFACRVSLVAI